jgi:hypothetical protein
MNIGEAMTGKERSCRTLGSAMDVPGEKLIGPSPIIDSKKHDRARF